MRCALALVGVMSSVATASAGGTFEIGFGGGTETTRSKTDGAMTITTKAAGSSPTIAAGARLDDKTWLVGRISLAFAKHSSFAFFGGSLQYFPTHRFFIAGGLGAVEQDFEDPLPGTNTTGFVGFAFDVRAGVNLFPEYRHTILLQLELTPTIYRDTRSLGCLLLASYQYL